MNVRSDNRLDDAPMKPVVCGSCSARVLVRKSSWEQTSIQWDTASLRRCLRRHDASGETDSGGRWTAARPGLLPVCPQLRHSIEDSVREGSLPVLDDR